MAQAVHGQGVAQGGMEAHPGGVLPEAVAAVQGEAPTALREALRQEALLPGEVLAEGVPWKWGIWFQSWKEASESQDGLQ